VIRRITQNVEEHNCLPPALPSVWPGQTLSMQLLAGQRLVTLADLIRSEGVAQGLNHEHYRDGYQNPCGTLEQRRH
jgi:hypothetical protein